MLLQPALLFVNARAQCGRATSRLYSSIASARCSAQAPPNSGLATRGAPSSTASRWNGIESRGGPDAACGHAVQAAAWSRAPSRALGPPRSFRAWCSCLSSTRCMSRPVSLIAARTIDRHVTSRPTICNSRTIVSHLAGENACCFREHYDRSWSTARAPTPGPGPVSCAVRGPPGPPQLGPSKRKSSRHRTDTPRTPT